MFTFKEAYFLKLGDLIILATTLIIAENASTIKNPKESMQTIFL